MSKAIEEVYAALKRSFQGSLLRPDDGEYPEARRIWNGLVARKPGLIARCKDSSDVQAAVRAAAQAGACFRFPDFSGVPQKIQQDAHPMPQSPD
jgi:hypothetical protein